MFGSVWEGGHVAKHGVWVHVPDHSWITSENFVVAADGQFPLLSSLTQRVKAKARTGLQGLLDN